MKRNYAILLVLLLCSAIMADNAVYTISSKTSLTVSNAPDGSEYEFEQTGTQKERMTAGSHTNLTLRGYKGVKIEAVSLSMKSNKASGSGWLTMTIDGLEVWHIDNQSFNNTAWYGEYSTEYVEITKMLYLNNVPIGDEINIYIESTENSLYINQFTIAYTAINDSAYNPDEHKDDTTHSIGDTTETKEYYTVRFETQLPNQGYWEEYVPIGEDLLIPSIKYNDGYWSFVGWSETLLDSVSNKVEPIWFPDDIIIVDKDITYYARYRHRLGLEISDTIQDGDYVISYRTQKNDYLLYNKNGTLTLELIDLNDYYHSAYYNSTIEKTTDTTFYIKYDNKYLSPNWTTNFTQLSTTPYNWQYEKTGENDFSIVTYSLNQKYYLGMYDIKPRIYEPNKYNYNYVWHFYNIPPYINQPIFCSYPQGKPSDIRDVNEDYNIEIKANQIHNPTLQNIKIVSIMGQTISNSNNEVVDLTAYKNGLYIVVVNDRYSCKILKR